MSEGFQVTTTMIVVISVGLSFLVVALGGLLGWLLGKKRDRPTPDGE